MSVFSKEFNKKLQEFAKGMYMDLSDFISAGIRIFYTALWSFLMILFINGFGSYLQFMTGYENGFNMGELSWVLGVSYFVIKTLMIVFYSTRAGKREYIKEELK